MPLVRGKRRCRSRAHGPSRSLAAGLGGGSADAAAALRALCRAGLAGYKQPKGIHFIALEDFPRSVTGKIQRHELERRLPDLESEATT